MMMKKKAGFYLGMLSILTLLAINFFISPPRVGAAQWKGCEDATGCPDGPKLCATVQVVGQGGEIITYYCYMPN
jgi:hypothetical protein